MAAVIETDGLTKRWGSVTAVSELTLRVRAGECYAFLGRNGAGKSTTSPPQSDCSPAGGGSSAATCATRDRRARLRACHHLGMSLLASIGLFAAVVVTWVAVSGPGEAALVGAGAIAARGEEEVVPVLVIAFAGTVAGSIVAYWIGRAGGRRLLLRPGPLLGWRARALARSEAITRRRAFLTSLLGPGWLAGVNEISARPFLAGVALSGLAWTLVIGLGTFYVGPSLVSLYDDVSSWATIAAAIVASAVGAVLLIRRSRRHRLSAEPG